MRKDIAVGHHHGAFLAGNERSQLEVLHDADNSQRILVANRRVDELLTNDVIDARHFLHLPSKLLVHQHLRRPAFTVQAFEVAAAHNLESHRLHQSALGKEQIDTVEQFLWIAWHQHIVATLLLAKKGIGGSRLLDARQTLHLTGQ